MRNFRQCHDNIRKRHCRVAQPRRFCDLSMGGYIPNFQGTSSSNRERDEHTVGHLSDDPKSFGCTQGNTNLSLESKVQQTQVKGEGILQSSQICGAAQLYCACVHACVLLYSATVIRNSFVVGTGIMCFILNGLIVFTFLFILSWKI